MTQKLYKVKLEDSITGDSTKAYVSCDSFSDAVDEIESQPAYEGYFVKSVKCLCDVAKDKSL